MTNEEKERMMAEIMQVVEKHIAKSESSEEVTKNSQNKYGREFGISDEKMSKWKEEYKKMRVDTKAILEQVRRNPIDISLLDGCPSFDLETQSKLLK